MATAEAEAEATALHATALLLLLLLPGAMDMEAPSSLTMHASRIESIARPSVHTCRRRQEKKGTVWIVLP